MQPTPEADMATDTTHFRVELARSTTSFEVAPNQAILDAALRANAWIPHSCTQGNVRYLQAQGAVGDRRSRRFTGVHAVDRGTRQRPDAGLPGDPQGDLVVEPLGATDDGAPPPPAGLHRRGRRAGGYRRRHPAPRRGLGFPDGVQRGQYCELIVPALARQYSMANPPDENRRLEFHIKRTPGGLATDGWIFRSLEVGDRST